MGSWQTGGRLSRGSWAKRDKGVLARWICGVVDEPIVLRADEVVGLEQGVQAVDRGTSKKFFFVCVRGACVCHCVEYVDVHPKGIPSGFVHIAREVNLGLTGVRFERVPPSLIPKALKDDQ